MTDSEILARRAEIFALRPVQGPVADLAVKQAKRCMPFTNLLPRFDVSNMAGSSKMTYEYEEMSDPGEAVADVEFLSPGRNDSCAFTMNSVPLLFTHADAGRFIGKEFVLYTREEVDANPALIEAPARRVGEMVERMFLGIAPPADVVLHGVTTFPNRRTRCYDRETRLVDLVKTMVDDLRGDRFYGPFALLVGRNIDIRLSYDGVGEDKTVLDNVLEIDWDEKEKQGAVHSILSIPYPEWANDRLALVQPTPEVIRCVDGMSLRVLPWKDGYKVVCILVPQVLADYRSNCGIVEANSWNR